MGLHNDKEILVFLALLSVEQYREKISPDKFKRTDRDLVIQSGVQFISNCFLEKSPIAYNEVNRCWEAICQ
jgi:hypothetical protein